MDYNSPMMFGHVRRLILITLCAGTLCGQVRGAGDPLLFISPAAWESAVEEYSQFKTRLGFAVTNATTEQVAGTNELAPPVIRQFLSAYASNHVPRGTTGYVVLVGNFNTIPAPDFRVLPGDSLFPSDIYYRDLHTEFDRDGDGTCGEYDEVGTTQDFDSATFDGVFAAISNDLVVGRLPFNAVSTDEQVAGILGGLTEFEREVSSRKSRSIMTAGRILDSVMLPAADSWHYVLKGIVETLRSTYTNNTVTTVVHAGATYTNREGMDYVVEGDDITGDYVYGQDIVRGLFETNGGYAFLANVSHGDSRSDFAITRDGNGFPENVQPAVMLSMSCASFHLGRAAFLQGFAAAHISSTATVTPDYPRFVSGEVQEYATIEMVGENRRIGNVFSEGFSYYVREIQSVATLFIDQPSRLRNTVGFQIIGDPTLVLAYPDSDGDTLLDAEEETLGTDPELADTDDDGMDDADELVAGTSPTNQSDVLCFIDISAAGSNSLLLQWQSVSGHTYRAEASESLDAAVWTNITESIDSTGSVATAVVTNRSPSCRFYRLSISGP